MPCTLPSLLKGLAAEGFSFVYAEANGKRVDVVDWSCGKVVAVVAKAAAKYPVVAVAVEVPSACGCAKCAVVERLVISHGEAIVPVGSCLHSAFAGMGL